MVHYCFSPATMAARTLINGTLYVHCLSFLHLIVFLSDLSSCHALSITYINFCFTQKKMILSPLVLDINFLSQIQRYILFRRYSYLIVENGEDGFKSFVDISMEFYASIFKVCESNGIKSCITRFTVHCNHLGCLVFENRATIHSEPSAVLHQCTCIYLLE